MQPWIEDILDQLSTAHLLAHADISCGERLALIVVDNAVEYMCKTYIEVHKRLVTRIISRKDWEEKKKVFADMLDFVAGQEPSLQPHLNTINGFHGVRNNLYHGGQPATVKPATVDAYDKVARIALGILLGVTEDESSRDERISRIHRALLGEAKKEIKAGVTFESVNNAIRFTTVGNITASDAILLVLHGFSQQKGNIPTREQLEESLSLSGHSLDRRVLNARLSDLRRSKLVRKKELALTAAGRNQLHQKYLS